MLRTALAVAALFAVLDPAVAQVYKCKEDGTGKISFSDAPCQGKNVGDAIAVQPANQFDGSRLRQEAARRQWEEARPSGPAGGAIGDGRPEPSMTGPNSRLCAEMKKPLPGANGLTAAQRRSIVAACAEAPTRSQHPVRGPRTALCDDLLRAGPGPTGYTVSHREALLSACGAAPSPGRRNSQELEVDTAPPRRATPAGREDDFSTKRSGDRSPQPVRCDYAGCRDGGGTYYPRGAGDRYISNSGTCRLANGMMYCP